MVRIRGVLSGVYAGVISFCSFFWHFVAFCFLALFCIFCTFLHVFALFCIFCTFLHLFAFFASFFAFFASFCTLDAKIR